MAQLVKVTPSMSGERMESAVGAAVPGLSTRKTSQGIELMEDETEEFSCEARQTSKLTEGFVVRLMKKIKYYVTCQCICECSIPKESNKLMICLTNKRLILRQRYICEEPGIKKCCYYATCMCCCPTEVQTGSEEQICFQRKDIKEYEFKLNHHNTRISFLCCLCSEKTVEGFTLKLFFAKTIGETRMGWDKWGIDKDVKTYAMVKEFNGYMPKADSVQLRQVLHAVVAQNAAIAAAGPLGTFQKDVRSDPVNLNINLG